MVQTWHILYILNLRHGLHSSPARQEGHAEAVAADVQPLARSHNVPLGVAAPGRAGDEGAQSRENPDACPSKCPPLGTLDDRLLILPTATPWH